jgi:putative oxidoreductase
VHFLLSRFLAPRAEAAYALLRVVAGLAFSFHGFQKIFGFLSTFRPPAGSQLWFAGMIELVAGLLIAAGLLTSWASLLSSGEMAVAYVQVHWKLQMGAAFFPTINKGELALLYGLLFLFVACRGSGPWGLDAAFVGSAGREAPAPARAA